MSLENEEGKQPAEEMAEELVKETEEEHDWKKAAEEIRKKFTFGEIVTLFNKTPPVKNPTDAFCPHFMELKHSYGCWYNCDWCYLQGTTGRWYEKNDMRDPRRPELVGSTWTPKFKDKKEIAKWLDKALDTLDKPTLFNAGELSDSLVNPSVMANTIIPIFNKYKDKGHKLLILTKSDNTDVYKIGIKHHAPEFTIVSHSINAQWVANTHEIGAPDPIRRLAASKVAAELKYETRLRLDPMVPVNNWQVGYRKIAQEIMRINPKATVITLGSLRGLQSTINVGNKLKKAHMTGDQMTWTLYLKDSSSWGKKIPLQTRIEMYSYVINELKRLKYNGDFALCKETVEVWDALRKGAVIDTYPGETLCNCVMERPGKIDYHLKRTFKPLEE